MDAAKFGEGLLEFDEMGNLVGVGGRFNNEAFFRECIISRASALGKAADELVFIRGEVEYPGVFGAKIFGFDGATRQSLDECGILRFDTDKNRLGLSGELIK